MRYKMLPATRRRALKAWGLHYRGHTYAETAAVLGVSRERVRQMVCRIFFDELRPRIRLFRDPSVDWTVIPAGCESLRAAQCRALTGYVVPRDLPDHRRSTT